MNKKITLIQQFDKSMFYKKNQKQFNWKNWCSVQLYCFSFLSYRKAVYLILEALSQTTTEEVLADNVTVEVVYNILICFLGY